MKVPPISPLLFYRDPKAALAFLESAFGFETRMVVDDGQGGVIHSEIAFEEHVVMISGPPSGLWASPLDLGGRRTGSVHVEVPGGIDAQVFGLVDHTAAISEGDDRNSPTAIVRV